ncbi:MAG: Rieske (2Fe-2S) protein [Nitrososphaerales archaeon]
MDRIKVGNISEFKELSPKMIAVKGSRVFVYLYKERFYAYADICPHQGGPACEGDVRGSVIGQTDGTGLYIESISKEQYSIVCPWHGVEYDLENGECRTNRRQRLRHYDVVVENDDVFLT